MDKLNIGKVNNGTFEYCLTEQLNINWGLSKPPLANTKDGLFCILYSPSPMAGEGRSAVAPSPLAGEGRGEGE